MEHTIHKSHTHKHGENCGHTAIQHGDHIGYIHDGHLHKVHDDHYDECRIEIDETNPAICTNGHECEGHEKGHIHGENCGHEAIPHGDHIDYLVNGHLHHYHNGHCDNHGNVTVL